VQSSKKHIIIGTLWPSFWMAIILSGLIFSAVDPIVMASHMGFHDISALGGYTIGFFLFWGAFAWSGFFSIVFSQKR
jgi:hypothetical protein